MWQQAGPGWGLLASGIDVAKGIGTVLLVRSLDFDIGVIVLAGLAATCGQIWPVFKGFDGEKGNTTGFGAALAIAPLPTLLALVPVLLAIFSKGVKALRLKNVPPGQRFKTGAGHSAALPIGVLIAFAVLPLLSMLFDEPAAVVLGFVALFILVIVRRLTAGLSPDLKSGASRRTIFWSRFLLDRPVS